MDYNNSSAMSLEDTMKYAGNEETLEVLKNISYVHERLFMLTGQKLELYGTSRYDRHHLQFDVWMNFSDVYRKFIRLQNLTERVSDGEEGLLPLLQETYADLANYAISALAVFQNREERFE